MNKKIIGVSGDIGSFSEKAALLYLQRNEISASLKYLIDMEGVLAAVETSGVEIGIFPVFNFLGGLVKPAFAAMGNHLFTPIDEYWLEINHCLLSLPGIKKTQIKNIISHPQAFAQCKKYLANSFKEAKLIEWIDTAKAARDLAAGILPADTAVIASENAGQQYKLKLLAKDIQDQSPNITIFITVKRNSTKR